MSHSPLFEPPADFADPRTQPEFQPEHWPLCDGQSGPPLNPPGLHERRCLEFLAAFYRLNLLNARLLAARSAAGAGMLARALLAEIATTTANLERLEDRYAPIGFFGEPIMDGIRYLSIGFVRPEQPRFYPKASALSSLFAIPGIEEIPTSELSGPARIIHYGQGKVDI